MYFENPDIRKELEAAIDFSDNLEDYVALAHEVKNIDDIKWFILIRKEEVAEFEQKLNSGSLNQEDQEKFKRMISKVESNIEWLERKVKVLEKIKLEMDSAPEN